MPVTRSVWTPETASSSIMHGPYTFHPKQLSLDTDYEYWDVCLLCDMSKLDVHHRTHYNSSIAIH